MRCLDGMRYRPVGERGLVSRRADGGVPRECRKLGAGEMEGRGVVR